MPNERKFQNNFDYRSKSHIGMDYMSRANAPRPWETLITIIVCLTSGFSLGVSCMPDSIKVENAQKLEIIRHKDDTIDIKINGQIKFKVIDSKQILYEDKRDTSE